MSWDYQEITYKSSYLGNSALWLQYNYNEFSTKLMNSVGTYKFYEKTTEKKVEYDKN